jgi:hypothetical protein
LKNGGSLSGGGRIVSPGAEAAKPAASDDHPIKPMLIGTGNDAQLSAALDYLQRAVRQDTSTHRG